MALGLTLSPREAALLATKLWCGVQGIGYIVAPGAMSLLPMDRWPLEMLEPGQPSVPSSTGTWFSRHTSQPGGADCREWEHT